jgi:hypothetical protein
MVLEIPLGVKLKLKLAHFFQAITRCPRRLFFKKKKQIISAVNLLLVDLIGRR